jgi:hypothetical protein
MASSTTVGAVKTFLFPAYYGEYGGAAAHEVECVVTDYLASLTPEQILTVLERHARRTAPGGHDHTPAGGRLLRALGRMGDGAYPTESDLAPGARDAALGDAIRELHAAVPGRWAPAGRVGTHADYVAHLLGA